MDRMKRIGWMLAGLVLMACSSEETDSPQQHDGPGSPSKSVVDIVTRVSEGESNGAGLQAGLYMVNYAKGQQVPLQASGNYVNNLQMDYSDGSWVPATPIYWQDTNINADFYAYAPYTGQVDDARKMPLRVATDQTDDENFQKSDFLWGTTQGQSPAVGKFNLTLGHQLSHLKIVITQGAGFSEGELTADHVAVAIGGSKTLGMVDLQSGTVTATGEVADVKCHHNGDLTYTAILLPQHIAFANLVKINWKGNSYTLQNSFLLEGRKQYQLTIKLNKTQGKLDIGIEGWDIIDEDFGGTVG